MPNPKSHSTWQELTHLQKETSHVRLSSLFSNDPHRFERFSMEVGSLFVDYSKNFINQDVLNALLRLAKEQSVETAIRCIAQGSPHNQEVPAVPYMAMRDPALAPIMLQGKDISSDIRNTQFQMERICNDVRSWNWRGFSDKPITDIVTLGVGGAANATEAVTRALKPFQTASINSHFVSNVDSETLRRLLTQLQPDTTLFIISSKSFNTQETLQNARIAKQWVQSTTHVQEAMKQHFLAITAQKEAAIKFGIHEDNILPVWEWLPGRYSLWSAAGLPVALAVGMERFKQLLAGAHRMDDHFTSSPLQENLPVLMALLSVWYINFWNAPHHAILPYTEALELFPGFVQHCLMESNGKSVDVEGGKVDYNTSSVIWGTAGSSSQHTYFQLLHQGTHTIPADFIVATSEPISGRNRNAFVQLLAQTEALMMGDKKGKILNHEAPLREQALPGNKPSTTLLLKELSPYSLGQLMALYEHIALVQSVLWNINPFSHWGTELSKRYSTSFTNAKTSELNQLTHDSSTLGLLKQYQRWKQPAFQSEQTSIQQEVEENSYPFF